MNLDAYRHFVAIVDAGTISAASRELHIAQPALSTQLRALEDAYGARLVERGARQLTMTNAGHILYEKARRICLLEDAAQKDIQASLSGTMGVLHIGLTPAYPDPLISQLLLDFGGRYPRVSFDIVEANSNQLLSLLHTGEIEIAVVRTPTQLSPLFSTACSIEEHMMVAYHRRNPWLSAKLDAIPITALDGVPLSLARGFSDRITSLCLEAGFTPIIRSVASSRFMTLLWTSLETTATIFVCPPNNLPEQQDICYRPLIGSHMDTYRSITTLKERTLSAVANVFLQFARQRLQSVGTAAEK